jgi:hypothetical protein
VVGEGCGLLCMIQYYVCKDLAVQGLSDGWQPYGSGMQEPQYSVSSYPMTRHLTPAMS